MISGTPQDGKRELAITNCPLTCVCMLWHQHVYTHTHNNNNNNHFRNSQMVVGVLEPWKYIVRK